MASINVDSKIVDFVKSHPGRFGGKNLSSVIAEAILYLHSKKDDCFACPYHTSQVVGYYLGMQRKSLQLARAAGPEKRELPEPVCANCDKRMLQLAKGISVSAQFSSMAKVVNDALVEHVTRPKECQLCPCYASMREVVAARLKEIGK